MKRYDICFVSSKIPPEFAGAGKRALNQAKFIANKGYDVLFLTKTKTNSNLENLDIKTINLPEWYSNKGLTYKFLRKLYLPLYFKKMFSMLKESGVKIIHCIRGSSWISLLATLIGSRFLNAKVITETTLDGSDDPISIKKSRLGLIKFSLFNEADAIINISPLLYEKCKKAGINERKLHVIPNAVDIDTFSPANEQEKEELKEKLNINHEMIFLYVGIIRERKGVEKLVDIYSEVHEKYPDTALVLAGPQNKDKENREYTKTVKNKITEYDLGSNVIMPGRIDNVDDWMKSSDLFLFASQREGFGTVLVEAMSCGLPVIAKEIKGITNYIIEGQKSGFIVGDMEEFKEVMIELTENESKRRKISDQAREEAVNRFSFAVVMNQYFDLYNNLTKNYFDK